MLSTSHPLLASLLGCALYANAAPATSADQHSPSSTNGVKWGPCPGISSSAVQCGELAVPIDYSSPNGATLPLAMARVKSNSTNPRGSLFVNPGGPGGSGTQTVLTLLQVQAPQLHDLLESYDVIGVDPRGTGASQPVQCDPKLWNERVSDFVQSEDEFSALVNHWKVVGESCKAKMGPLFDHLDTINVVKDFERARQAVGDKKFNFLGLSYGTQIGYTYAEMYPDKVGRMVLDGMLDHTQTGSSSVQTESTSLEQTLHKFFDWCKGNTECALHDQGDVETFFRKLLATAETKPLPAPSCITNGTQTCRSDVSFGELLDSVQAALVFETSPVPGLGGWLALAKGLLEASKGDAASLSAPFFTNDTDVTGTWAFLAISCQDWGHAASFADLQGVEVMASALSPITKGNSQSLAFFARCIGWPAKLTNRQRELKSGINRAPEIMLVNAFLDPETSVQEAVSMREKIPSAHLVFRNGSGHTSYLLGGDVTKAMNGFLLEGKLPADGTVFDS